MPKGELRIIAPIGKVPAADGDLTERMRKLPREASLSIVGKELDEWEKAALRKFKLQERTTKSGRLDEKCWVKFHMKTE